MRIDRSDPADGSGDTDNAGHVHSAPDSPDATGKDRSAAVTGDGVTDSYPTRLDSGSRTERATAYYAKVDAAYRQDAIDHGYAQPKPHKVDLNDRVKGTGRLAPDADHDGDLPKGYKSAPALKGDPYHPDSVAARSAANRELYAATSRDQAAILGYTTRISAQKAPFDSHGQEVFTNGKNYITPDVDGHNVSNGWKMFNRRGARIGTYDAELNYVKE